MAQKSDAIASRLEGLKCDDGRVMFDSQIRAIRQDPRVAPIVSNQAPNVDLKSEPAQPIDQVITLLEELSRRIDGIEKKQRTFADEVRRRVRQDRSRRSISLVGGLAASGLVAAAWWLHWF